MGRAKVWEVQTEQEERERAILVGVELSGKGDEQSWPVEESLAELERLAETAGLLVVGTFRQSLQAPHPAFFIGSGKVAEIRAFREAVPFDVAIFDDDLSPSQQRNLERALGARVIDRRALILDIFAQHARTREGALQVELAQYEYLRPRLTRAWTHLSRQTRGGVGLRGPGETQLELDRRRMRERIAKLRRELEAVRRHRRLYRERRKSTGVPIVAIVGYTNAGKSTLLNAVSRANVYVADKLFATLDPTTRRVRLPGGAEALFTDTVGFVQKLPPDLVAAFHATLEEIEDADVILHVVDITHPQVLRQVQVVEETLQRLGVGTTPAILALNKIDLTSDPEAVRALAREQRGPVVALSALTGYGVDELLQTVADVLGESGVSIRAIVPYERTAILAAIYQYGTVRRREEQDSGTFVEASIPLRLLPQVQPYLL